MVMFFFGADAYGMFLFIFTNSKCERHLKTLKTSQKEAAGVVCLSRVFRALHDLLGYQSSPGRFRIAVIFYTLIILFSFLFFSIDKRY